MIAAYLRVSTDRQDESLQRQAIEKILPGEPVTWYIDHGITGTTTDRKAYTEMMQAIIEGRITSIYCYEWSRLWRNLADQTKAITFLLSMGVSAVSATEGKLSDFEDELIVNIKGAINQHEHKRTARRRVDGTQAKYRKVAEAMHRATQAGMRYEDIPTKDRWDCPGNTRKRCAER